MGYFSAKFVKAFYGLLHSREVFFTESPSAKSISGGDFI